MCDFSDVPSHGRGSIDPLSMNIVVAGDLGSPDQESTNDRKIDSCRQPLKVTIFVTSTMMRYECVAFDVAIRKKSRSSGVWTMTLGATRPTEGT